MKDHLNYDEMNQIVRKTPESLSRDRYLHFKECEKCQQEYYNQVSVDKVLKDIHPKSAPADILKGVLNKIAGIDSSLRIKEKTDWVFLIAIILLFAIGTWFIFSGKITTYFQEYTPQVISQNQNTEKMDIINPLKEEISKINFNFHLPHLSFGNMYLVLGLLAIMFYVLLDKKISSNFKTHKT